MSSFSNPLRQVWAEGRVAANGWLAVPSVLSVEAMAVAGWDVMTVDMQHGTADYADLLSLLPVIEKSGSASLVRVPWVDEAAIMRALDAGAMGIIAPMIETAADAERFVSACLYPPEGGRSSGPIRARLALGADYQQHVNREIVTLAMIETKSAVEDLEAILKVPGLTGVYIGPSDLGSAFGHGPGFDRAESEVLDLIEHIRKTTAAAGLKCCLHCGTPSYARGAADRGMDLVTISSDARFIEAGAIEAVSQFRQSGV
ncbi:HpcH/HpaI aldolase family protein [Roseibium sp. Sym1]|uniref:HpcH/HpaI aldolase family protein n=1 Tax=Roseibium sp. Sym1 TaxID=3016006 RepID=UPI0022B5250A|nr:aldolase/citrate lyase family protein [Roseibium sp. Sym1]